MFLYGCSSPSGGSETFQSSKKRNNMLNDLEYEMDTMMQDICSPRIGSSSKLPFYSSGIGGSFISSKHKSSSGASELQNQNCTQMKSLFRVVLEFIQKREEKYFHPPLSSELFIVTLYDIFCGMDTKS